MVFACPDCDAALGHSQSAFHCQTCDTTWAADRYGVIHMKPESYEYAHTDHSTQKLAAEVLEMGDEFFDPATIRDLENRYEEFGYGYCMDPSRFDWLSIGDFTDEVVVDIGCGFGGAAMHAAKQGAEQVYAIDGNVGRLSFLGAWAEKEGIESITPVHADALELEFRPDHIDHCIMTGSLEWMGAISDAYDSPTAAQEAILSAVATGLRPGGRLLIAIENRLALKHFFGLTSHVVEPRFGPLMPRKLADLVSRMTGRGSYDVYTYTYRGYKTILHRAGFDDVTFFLPHPSYQEPEFICQNKRGAFNEAIPWWRFSTPKDIAQSLLKASDRLGLAHWFTNAYIIQGEK